MTNQYEVEAHMKTRTFKNWRHQEIYDHLRANHPCNELDLSRIKGKGSACDAYVVGHTLPGEPPRRFARGTDVYAAWCAGKDNAMEDKTNDSKGEL